MWEGYVTAVDEFITQHDDVTAQLVVDRFHVAQHYRDGFDSLRKKELQRLKQSLPQETYEADCKGSLWLLRHNHDDLSDKERQQLRAFLVHSPACHQAYTLREELTAIFTAQLTPEQAEHRLTCWQEKVKKGAVTCFNKFLTTLKNHWQAIINYFIRRATSGFVEGINNKIQTLKRRCYGIRRVDSLFRRIWLDLQGIRRFLSPPDMLSTP